MSENSFGRVDYPKRGDLSAASMTMHTAKRIAETPWSHDRMKQSLMHRKLRCACRKNDIQHCGCSASWRVRALTARTRHSLLSSLNAVEVVRMSSCIWRNPLANMEFDF